MTTEGRQPLSIPLFARARESPSLCDNVGTPSTGATRMREVNLAGRRVLVGAMRTMMREACGGIEVVSRDDVTRFTQNLYEWVEDLDDSGGFEFGIPRHSQLIKRSRN